MGVASDVPAIVEYFTRNRTHLAPWDPKRTPEFYTAGHWHRQLGRNLTEFRQDHSLRLFLRMRAATDKIVGTVNLTNLARGPFQACSLGYAIDEREQ